MNAATVVRDRIVFMIWFIELRLGEKNIFPRKLDHELRASARICPGDFFEASRAHFSRSVTLRKERAFILCVHNLLGRSDGTEVRGRGFGGGRRIGATKACSGAAGFIVQRSHCSCNGAALRFCAFF